MEFSAYSEYKHSGVEWLGEVPSHWKIQPIKSLFKRAKKTGFENETLLSVYRDYGVIIKDSRDDNHNKASEDLSPYQLVNKGDLVINKMKAWQGSLAISELRGIVSPAYYIYETNKDFEFNPRFIHNQIRSRYFIQSYKNYSKGIRVGQWDLESDLFVRLNLYLPPIDEQNQIAQFLDKETAKIDELIAKQEQLITLLEEQRKSVISYAVTKGLNPNVPMKDSGVEWLGEVPEHWEIKPLKYLTTKISSGKTPLGGAQVYTDSGVMFLRSQNVYSDGLRLDDVSYISMETHNTMRSSEVFINDILLNITGGSLGRTCLVDKDIGIANVNQHVCIIRPAERENANWISYLMKSHSTQSQIFYYQTGAGREGLNFSQIANMKITFPDKKEQAEIIEFLEKENQIFDNLIQKQQELITQLKEYRSSVISHAVTGKIDVRGLV